RITAAADCDRRRAQGHQPLGLRSQVGATDARGIGGTPVRRRKGTITRQIDGVFYRSESYGFPAELMERWRNVPVTPERGSVSGRALLEGRTVQIPDVDTDPDFTFDRVGAGMRSVLGVPMLRDRQLMPRRAGATRCSDRPRTRRLGLWP